MARALQVLTANRLRDGEVVYWQAGRWTGSLAIADMFSDDGDARAALAAADASVHERIIVNPYLFAVRIEADGIHPVEEREIIRAAGPTIRRDLGKQARHVPV
jgi:hypothetical protein